MKTRLTIEASFSDLPPRGYVFDHNGCDGGPFMHPDNVAIPSTLDWPIGEVLAERCYQADSIKKAAQKLP